ncbi:unnamed protein product [Prorocentrum cordatum]|uniref:Z-binding domain-containing protein n=1 Tax=Prorocentrum cordatum TaxID=2364126 RepID=A0ABN9VJU8_9DINO|nr:unnamed protein product [Polarella glacialis]
MDPLRRASPQLFPMSRPGSTSDFGLQGSSSGQPPIVSTLWVALSFCCPIALVRRQAESSHESPKPSSNIVEFGGRDNLPHHKSLLMGRLHGELSEAPPLIFAVRRRPYVSLSVERSSKLRRIAAPHWGRRRSDITPTESTATRNDDEDGACLAEPCTQEVTRKYFCANDGCKYANLYVVLCEDHFPTHRCPGCARAATGPGLPLRPVPLSSPSSGSARAGAPGRAHDAGDAGLHEHEGRGAGRALESEPAKVLSPEECTCLERTLETIREHVEQAESLLRTAQPAAEAAAVAAPSSPTAAPPPAASPLAAAPSPAAGPPSPTAAALGSPGRATPLAPAARQPAAAPAATPLAAAAPQGLGRAAASAAQAPPSVPPGMPAAPSLETLILEALGATPEPMTAIDIARAVHRDRASDVNPTLFRLREEGSIEQAGLSGKRPTWRLQQ